MIRVISWNINNQIDPWHWLARMKERGEADLALLQEAGIPPAEIADRFRYESDVLEPTLLKQWPLVVQLSDKVEVKWFRQVPAIGWWRDDWEVESSGIGTLAVAHVVPCGKAEQAFLAVSMYARWTRAHPTTGKRPGIHADLSAHRILSDIQAFMNYADPSRYRILASGDLNLIYTPSRRGSWYPRERVVWDRFEALGLELLGPQAPNGRKPDEKQPGTNADTKNVPTYYTRQQGHAAKAIRQLDYAFASRGFHEQVRVRALNGLDEWGPSDHCRLLIEIKTD